MYLSLDRTSTCFDTKDNSENFRIINLDLADFSCDNFVHLHLLYTILLKGKLPQVFYGIPGFEVHVCVEKYAKQENL